MSKATWDNILISGVLSSEKTLVIQDCLISTGSTHAIANSTVLVSYAAQTRPN